MPAMVTEEGRMKQAIGAFKKVLAGYFLEKDAQKIVGDSRFKHCPDVKTLYESSAEERLGYEEYRDQLITPNAVEEGRLFMKRYGSALKEAGKRHDVDSIYIVSILGIESAYGKNTGSHVAINALFSIFADIPNKKEWAKREATALVHFCKLNGIDIFTVKGSYMGAVGPAQFIPSSLMKDFVCWRIYLRKPDPFDMLDCIESIANYLSNAGWVKGMKPESGNSNWKALLSYNPDEKYARVVTELAGEIKE